MADQKTLINLLTCGLSYDNNWAVYALKIDGLFTPDSPARLGNPVYENGGMRDDYAFFMRNVGIVDYVSTWKEENGSYVLGRPEAALIDYVNSDLQD